MTTLGEEIERAVGDAIEQIIRDREGGFTLRWLALVETSDPDGERGVWSMVSPGLTAWDTFGLLEYGKQLQAARIANS